MSLSRRDFLKTSGVLIVSFSTGSLIEPLAHAQGPFATHPSHIDPAKLDSWIAVANDGTVTAYTGKCDLGQGMLTAQTQLVAEELCVPMERVTLIQCDTAVTPDQGTTSGSQSTPTNFNTENLAQAAATAREALIAMASQKLGEPVGQLAVSDGVITGKSGRHASYGELIGGKKFSLPMSADARRRSPSEWKVLGKPVPSLDRVALMTGQFEFVHNVRVPGMLHGRILRPPEAGATVESIDESSIRRIPGVVKVVRRENFVGVVADKQLHAEQAARQLKVQWKSGNALPDQKSFYQTLPKQPSRDTVLVDSSDVDEKLRTAATLVQATYSYPFQMHGSIGASCAVADVKPDSATVWSATQSAYPTRSILAMLLGMPLESVRVIFVRGSGCYGLNGADAVSFDAALLSQAVGKPVRVQLSRSDEMVWENFGSACVIEQRAGLDQHGAIVAWESRSWVATRGGRPGYDRPGNVVTGMLAGYKSEPFTPRAAAQPSGEVRNGSNAVPSYVVGCISGKCGGAGTVKSERVLSHTVESPFFTGPLRSPVRIQNTFAHECFMDELCWRAKADPVAFRLQHLRDPRLVDVVKAAAQAAKWEPHPSTLAERKGLGSLQGRGIACVAYEGDNGYAALVAEIEVERATGRVQPKRFFCALDCGPVSNPNGLRNQIEGGILQGLSRALVEEVTWDDRKVTSRNWKTYHTLYLGIEVPAVDVVLLNRMNVPATGAGETAITLVAAAIGNAVFDATGARLREVPFTEERVKEALQS